MPIELSIGWTITVNVVGWLAIQMACAWGFTRLPSGWFGLPRARRWEGGGRFYESVFHIKSWKDRLPDGARWFGGGFAKATLAATSRDYLERFARETWRGELCHWTALAFTPLFFLWNPWWGDVTIVAYALAANLPCILVQRYNRARLQRLLSRAPNQAAARD